MAVVIRVGYFCTAGYTEQGGIHAFLGKLRPDIEWTRCFPAFEKPGPKLRKGLPMPSGITGQPLIERMLSTLEKYYQGDDCTFDVVLLIDDADCRVKDPKGELAEQLRGLPDEVRVRTGKDDLGFVALLASPEIEA